MSPHQPNLSLKDELISIAKTIRSLKVKLSDSLQTFGDRETQILSISQEKEIMLDIHFCDIYKNPLNTKGTSK
jgi:hypothetical protein